MHDEIDDEPTVDDESANSASPDDTDWLLWSLFARLSALSKILLLAAGLLIGSESVRGMAPMVQLQGVESALDLFAVDHDGRYPTEEVGLLALIEQPAGDADWKGPYYQGSTTVPIDGWGSPVRYEVKRLDDGRARVRIWSLGQDKLPETGDEIAAPERLFDAVRDFWPRTRDAAQPVDDERLPPDAPRPEGAP